MVSLSELTRLFDQYGVNLVQTADGGLKPVADQQPPAEVLDRMRDGVRQHRATLITRRLQQGARANGRYYLADLLPRAGCCASCAHWEPHAPADLLGRCALVGGWGIHAAHRCPVDKWEARA